MALKDSYLPLLIAGELADIVGDNYLSRAEADRHAHAVDYYWINQMWVDRGGQAPLPDYVVSPGSVDEVAALLRVANKYRIPVIPFGGGSGSQGGITALTGGMTLNLKRLNRVLRIDPYSCTVTVQTGIFAYGLEESLQREGLTLNHYPASIYCSTLGGFLAHRGSGVLSTKYGKIDDMVLGMEVVLPQGQIIRIPPGPAHSAGPDLNRLFLGSEGTLGVMTEATLKVHPAPEERRFRAVRFPTLHDGFEAGRKIMLARLRPTVIRLYDEVSTRKFVKAVLGMEVDGVYMVIGFDGHRPVVDFEESLALKICGEHAGADLGPEPGRLWWENRYKFYFPPHTPAPPTAFGTMDVLSTFDRCEKIYAAMKEAVEHGFPGVVFTSHLSHWYEWGCMQYNRFFLESPPEDPEQAFRLYQRIWNSGIRAALAEGALLNDHHGIGIKLARFMPESLGPAFGVLEAIKKALDPNNVMNPGKLGFGL